MFKVDQDGVRTGKTFTRRHDDDKPMVPMRLLDWALLLREVSTRRTQGARSIARPSEICGTVRLVTGSVRKDAGDEDTRVPTGTPRVWIWEYANALSILDQRKVNERRIITM